MFSYADKVRAVELYFKYGKKASRVVQELGYPSTRQLRRWARIIQAGGVLPESVPRKPRYTSEQKRAAVEHYLNHGCCLVTRAGLWVPRKQRAARIPQPRYRRPCTGERMYLSRKQIKSSIVVVLQFLP